MKFSANLSEFNRRMAEAVLQTFATDVRPVQSDDGTLLFRGPIRPGDDPTQLGTHVAVSLDKDVTVALDAASPEEREEMTEILINNLGTQVQSRYNASKLGPYELDIVGTMQILRG